MTTKEAITVVLSLLPNHSVFATKEAISTLYSHGGRDPEIRETYSISVLPALDGGSCQRFDGQSFEYAVEQIRAAVTPVVSSGNDE